MDIIHYASFYINKNPDSFEPGSLCQGGEEKTYSES